MLSSKLQARRGVVAPLSILTTVLMLAACGGGGSSAGDSLAGAAAGELAGPGVSVNDASGAGGSGGSTNGASSGANKDGANGGSTGGNSGSGSTGGNSGSGSTGGNSGSGSTGGTGAGTVTIDYYGDSTVWGYRSGSGGQVATPAPTAFAAALPAGTRYVVRNEGVSATTACQLLNGTDGKHPKWDTQLANSDADVVIVNHAINDEWQMDLATYKACLGSLAQKAKSAGKKIVFETPNPTRDSYASGLDTWAQAMRDVARQQGVPVIDQYQYLKDYLAGASPLTICPDGLHPTEAVYVMKGQYAARVWPTLGL